MLRSLKPFLSLKGRKSLPAKSFARVKQKRGGVGGRMQRPTRRKKGDSVHENMVHKKSKRMLPGVATQGEGANSQN